MIRFHPKLLDTPPGYSRAAFTNDLSAGITVGVLTLPLAMAFAIASGLSPVAGMTHALVLLAIVLAAAPLAAHIPLATLSAIVVAVNMGEWHAMKWSELRRYSNTYRIVLLATFFITVVFDLTRTLQKRGIGLILCDLNAQPRSLVARSGFADKLGKENIAANIVEALKRAQHVQGRPPEVSYV